MTSQYYTLKTFTDKINVLNSFTILQINSRSLIKNFDKIENLLITLKPNPDIHVIAISETKLKININFPTLYKIITFYLITHLQMQVVQGFLLNHHTFTNKLIIST